MSRPELFQHGQRCDFHVYLPKDVAEWLTKEAYRRRESVSAVLRALVTNEMRQFHE